MAMKSRHHFDPSVAVADSAYDSTTDGELGILRDIFRLLPSGVTLQDERGDFLLVNDVAAAQLGITADAASRSREMDHRRDTCIDVLRYGQPSVAEETVTHGPARQVLLTSHRPVRVANRDLLLSSSTDISEQKAVEDQLFRSAYYDELTDLPTRRVIEHRANSLLRHDRAPAKFALAFLDIDNFKHINDYYGHAAGDTLLIEVPTRPGPVLGATNTLRGARGTEIFASTSIGVSLYPEHGCTYDELRQNADIAMYRVKANGKGTAVFFDASMEREALARMKVEQSLRLAILEKRFCCAFQAKVDIRSQAIKGIEALVRLRDDEGVIQAPGTFINLAVELGLIDELTHLVLAEIVRSIDLINETFGHDCSISMNVAAKQACNPEFMRSLAQALEATGYPERFMIEVTEDAFVTKTQFQNEILPIFRQLGVGISIEDLGIGYSSLSALADITADDINIDRSFITDIHKRPRSQGILRAIESLSEALGMTVIAEGIETFEELAYLQAATRIRYAQGFYFSRPIFLEELKPATRILSESRVSLANRPQQESRAVHWRGDRYRRGSGGKPACSIPRLTCYRRHRERPIDCRAMARRDGAPCRSPRMHRR